MSFDKFQTLIFVVFSILTDTFSNNKKKIFVS
jgi:hypothetical protein